MARIVTYWGRNRMKTFSTFLVSDQIDQTGQESMCSVFNQYRNLVLDTNNLIFCTRMYEKYVVRYTLTA